MAATGYGLPFAVRYGTGMRIGRHWGCGTTTSARPSATCRCGAPTTPTVLAPSRRPRTIPVRAELIRLYADYLYAECVDLDSD